MIQRVAVGSSRLHKTSTLLRQHRDSVGQPVAGVQLALTNAGDPITMMTSNPLDEWLRSDARRMSLGHDRRPVDLLEVRYLDLAGEGTPDAVEIITRRVIHRGPWESNLVEETTRLAYGIGIDGKPTGVRQRTAVVSRV